MRRDHILTIRGVRFHGDVVLGQKSPRRTPKTSFWHYFFRLRVDTHFLIFFMCAESRFSKRHLGLFIFDSARGLQGWKSDLSLYGPKAFLKVATTQISISPYNMRVRHHAALKNTCFLPLVMLSGFCHLIILHFPRGSKIGTKIDQKSKSA